MNQEKIGNFIKEQKKSKTNRKRIKKHQKYY